MNAGPGRMSSNAVEFHDTLAAQWDAGYRSPTFSCRLVVIEELLPAASGRWLDAGCGTGTIARWMRSTYGCDVHAIDASPAMIAEAKRHGTKAQVGSIEQLPYLTSSFDGIVCSSVIEYMDDPSIALREFFRVLKPGGVLLVSVPRFHWLTFGLTWWLHYLTFGRWYSFLKYSKHTYGPESFRATLANSGFHPEEHRSFNRIALPLGASIDVGGTLMMFRARAVKS